MKHTKPKPRKCPIKGPRCAGIVATPRAKACFYCSRRPRDEKGPKECPIKGPNCLGAFVSPRATGCHPCARMKPYAANRVATDGVVVRGDQCEITKTTRTEVRTLEDLVRVCQIDTAVWNIVEWQCKASQQMNVPRATRANEDGKWTRPSTEPVLTQMFHVSAKLKKKSVFEHTMSALSTGLLADIRTEVRRGAVAQPKRRYVKGDWLFEFTPFDLHMGKLTWAEETVTHYDIDIAADLFEAALDFLLTRALRLAGGTLSRVLFVCGNDVAHIDNKKATTTAGTPMDVDTRYIKVYRRICAIHLRAVQVLSQAAPVDIKVVPGNHDELTSFHLGEILAARYHGAKHVTVDNSANLRKYYDFGTNLFGFAHGDSEKVTELPLLMARERPELWARCTSREWHIGHKHIAEKHSWHEQDMFSDKGVRVRRLASLSAHDAWHTKHAYTDRRACDSFVFHREAGFTDHLSFNVDHFTGKALSR